MGRSAAKDHNASSVERKRKRVMLYYLPFAEGCDKQQENHQERVRGAPPAGHRAGY